MVAPTLPHCTQGSPPFAAHVALCAFQSLSWHSLLQYATSWHPAHKVVLASLFPQLAQLAQVDMAGLHERNGEGVDTARVTLRSSLRAYRELASIARAQKVLRSGEKKYPEASKTEGGITTRDNCKPIRHPGWHNPVHLRCRTPSAHCDNSFKSSIQIYSTGYLLVLEYVCTRNQEPVLGAFGNNRAGLRPRAGFVF